MKTQQKRIIDFVVNCEEVYHNSIIDYDYCSTLGKQVSLSATAYMGECNKQFAIINIPMQVFENLGLPRKQSCRIVSQMLSKSWLEFLQQHQQRLRKTNTTINSLLSMFFNNLGFPKVIVKDTLALEDEQPIAYTTMFYCDKRKCFMTIYQMMEQQRLPIQYSGNEKLPMIYYRGNGSLSVDIQYYTAFQTLDNEAVYVYVKANTLTCRIKNRNERYKNFFERTYLKRPHLLIQLSNAEVEDVFVRDITKEQLLSKPRTIHFFESEQEVFDFAVRHGIKNIKQGSKSE